MKFAVNPEASAASPDVQLPPFRTPTTSGPSAQQLEVVRATLLRAKRGLPDPRTATAAECAAWEERKQREIRELAKQEAHKWLVGEIFRDLTVRDAIAAKRLRHTAPRTRARASCSSPSRRRSGRRQRSTSRSTGDSEPPGEQPRLDARPALLDHPVQKFLDVLWAPLADDERIDALGRLPDWLQDAFWHEVAEGVR